jgi:hypothetical protein
MIPVLYGGVTNDLRGVLANMALIDLWDQIS